jgi:hypothetical protein
MKDFMREELGAPKVVDRTTFQDAAGRIAGSREGSHKRTRLRDQKKLAWSSVVVSDLFRPEVRFAHYSGKAASADRRVGEL